MVIAEKLVAQSYPIYDQRYASDPKNPLKLYDCLIPQTTEQMSVPAELYTESFVQDLKLRIDLKHKGEETVSHQAFHLTILYTVKKLKQVTERGGAYVKEQELTAGG